MRIALTPGSPARSWRQSTTSPKGGRQLALFLDPTTKQVDLVTLVNSVVYRQHAIPVAWHNVGTQAKGSWIDHFCLLLAPAVPATAPMHVLCDQGLGSRDLWAQIVAFGHPLGGHPCLRYQPRITFQPEGQAARVPVRALITGPAGRSGTSRWTVP